MLILDKDYKQLAQQLVNWLQDRVKTIGARGLVVGLSGGIDSSVTGVLCQQAFPRHTMGLIMPCESNPRDREHALLLVDKYNIEYRVVDLDDTYNTMLKGLDSSQDDHLARANIKPRLRMTTLYYYANLRDSLVAGTGNRSELELGYFTKYGDGGVDLEPLGNLVKTEVREMAMALNIPREIIDKKPSAGLWKGQSDEEELGFSYQEVDNYLLNGKSSQQVTSTIEQLQCRNRHKLESPAIPNIK
ncbi:MAG: NAD+ synthase [Bacillota bacterium]